MEEKRGEMSGGKGREWMRFGDKDFDRWKID